MLRRVWQRVFVWLLFAIYSFAAHVRVDLSTTGSTGD